MAKSSRSSKISFSDSKTVSLCSPEKQSMLSGIDKLSGLSSPGKTSAPPSTEKLIRPLSQEKSCKPSSPKKVFRSSHQEKSHRNTVQKRHVSRLMPIIQSIKSVHPIPIRPTGHLGQPVYNIWSGQPKLLVQPIHKIKACPSHPVYRNSPNATDILF